MSIVKKKEKLMSSILSIIAPCYNGEFYISRFLEAVLNQTYDYIELIVINDGSHDGTEDILKSYENKFVQRGYLYHHIQQNNQGIGASINNVLQDVQGDYLTWFGTDDWPYPTYSQELVSFLDEHEEFSVVRSDGDLVRESEPHDVIRSYTSGNNDKDNPNLFENAIMERGFHFGYSVVRMSAFDDVNPERKIYPSRQGQNWQLLLPVFYKYKSSFYHKSLYAVVDNAGSVSRDPHKDYEKLKKQNEEYEAILVNTLKQMRMAESEREKYFDIIEEKYIRRRMCAAVDFKQYCDAKMEYSKLREIGKNTIKDDFRYIRACIPVIDKVLRFIKRPANKSQAPK